MDKILNKLIIYLVRNYRFICAGPDHTYMTKANIYNFLDKIPINTISEHNLVSAYKLFPEDAWPLYWLGFAAAEKKQYAKALEYFQQLFEHELATCMEVLPLAYRKAAFCAGKLRNKALEETYITIADSLYNEYSINVDGYYDTGHLYKK